MKRYVTLDGWAVIDGYEPDGDTLRLVPDALAAVLALPRGRLVAPGARTSVVASVNASLLAAGLVYPLAYDSQPRAHRAKFGALAEAARRAGKGVWAHDRSREGFLLRSEASLGPHGALVFPKLFRRSVTFLREASRGVGFREWLRSWSEADDAVRIGEVAWRRLSDLLGARGGLVRVERDLIGVTGGAAVFDPTYQRFGMLQTSPRKP